MPQVLIPIGNAGNRKCRQALLSKVKFLVFSRCIITKYFPILGVVSVLVGLLARKAEVKYNASQISPEKIARCVTDMGYHAEVLSTGDENTEIELIVSLQ